MTLPVTVPDLEAIRDLEPSRNREPIERLLLAILQQAVLDYFTGSERLQRDALRYFQDSVLYRLTLQLFNLPPDSLPQGVELDDIPSRLVVPPVTTEAEAEATIEELHLNGQTVSLLPLMQMLKGNRLHIFLTIHLLEQPAGINDIVDMSGLSEDTVRRQMVELQEMGLLKQVSTAETPKAWIVADGAAAIVTNRTI
jgi:hypothetical protein